jgi:hypothetical protein
MKIKNKPYLDKTTIQVTDSILPVYDKLVARYGVTVAVCTGILLLESLNPDVREEWIDKVNLICDKDKQNYESAINHEDDAAAKRIVEAAVNASEVLPKKKPGKSSKPA